MRPAAHCLNPDSPAFSAKNRIFRIYFQGRRTMLQILCDLPPMNMQFPILQLMIFAMQNILKKSDQKLILFTYIQNSISVI